jgi:hypothetical protein
MDNLERINDIFDKTKDILYLWTTMGVEYNDNPQVSHILNYLSLTAGYLKSKEEAKIFKDKWEDMKETIKSGSNWDDWMNQSNMIRSHLEQALLEESVHNPKDERNIGVAHFYDNTFNRLYEDAKKEYESFQKKQDDMVKGMRDHYEHVHSSTENWLAALRDGDPAAFCD